MSRFSTSRAVAVAVAVTVVVVAVVVVMVQRAVETRLPSEGPWASEATEETDTFRSAGEPSSPAPSTSASPASSASEESTAPRLISTT